MTAVDYEAGYTKYRESMAYPKVGNRIVSRFRAAFRAGSFPPSARFCQVELNRLYGGGNEDLRFYSRLIQPRRSASPPPRRRPHGQASVTEQSAIGAWSAT